MKQITTTAMLLAMAVTSAYARDKRVTMTFSGTSENSATSLQQPDTSNDSDHFAGYGTAGAFTVRLVRAIANSPTPSRTCSGANELHLLESTGGGAFRFHDGSLLYLSLTQGDDCINLESTVAHCTLVFRITGGTGRFKNISGGMLTMHETVVPVLSDALHNPVFFAATGDFTGTLSGLDEEEEDSPAERQ